jgi:hypothetical protein
MRMGSSKRMQGNAAILAFSVVSGGSYYFCARKRDHQEKVIAAMMKLNAFEHASQMPAQTPLQEHPFAKPTTPGEGTDKEFRGLLKENKEWQPREVNKNMKEVFTEEGRRR